MERRASLDFELFACWLGALGLLALAVVSVRYPELLSHRQMLIYFGGACLIPFLASWRKAIREGRMPANPVANPREHISGWSFIALALAVSLIVGLAAWATSGERDISSAWGTYVVFGLAAAFAAAALIPLLLNASGPNGPIAKLGSLLRPLRWLAKPFGLALSFIDSIMVFAVAGGAGAGQSWLWMRYTLLFLSIVPCAVLGYTLDAPYGLIPIAWGFLVTISISRRWAWIEDDRELYMLNHKNGVAHLRIGFAQDLRDEALLSFMAMFFLVPLALKQAHDWSDGTLFAIVGGQPSFLDWIGYYGTELAKAVPFVDWAEIYQVEGAANIQATSANAKHVVFATRVLVDLVFLAALLQALAILARNAKQNELFNAGVMDRLDPFIEPREFRKLVRRDESGNWEADHEALNKFPRYDALRLAELSSPEHHPINIAARALRRRDNTDDAARFHEQLLERAFQKKPDPDAIDEVLTAIRMTDCEIQADQMDDARVAMNHKRNLNGVRENLINLVAGAPASPERTAALRSALLGQSSIWDRNDLTRDAVAPVRRVALRAFEQMALDGDTDAVAVIDVAANSDQAGQLRREARQMLERIRNHHQAG